MTALEVNDTNLKALATQFSQTLEASTTIQKQAQQSLTQYQQQPGFAILLLKLLSTDTVPQPIRQAGAVFFKNFIITYWVPDEDQKDVISEPDRILIKQHLVNLMLTAPKMVQVQLSEALTAMSKADFPAKWQSLLPELVSKLNTDQLPIILGVLETAHSIFHRYRYEMKSNALWEEIKYVLEQFQEPLTNLFKRLCQLSEQHATNATLLPSIFSALNLCVQIFYSLNAQDIPEYFEDHLSEWMTAFQAFLKMKNPLLDPKKNDEPGPLDELQAVICECINLYATKYEEQFKEQKDWTAVFVNDVWTLLTTQTTDQGRYDTLVNMAIRFLTSVVKKEWHKHLFQNVDHLKVICERVIIPQLKLRESDIEMFSTDGVEYIRRDMEGSDVDTRRRTTMDFVRGLCTHFEKDVSTILIGYVGKLLQDYQANKNANWQAKDVSMFVVLALSVKARTSAKGTTQTSSYVNIGDFFQQQVLPELAEGQDINERGIIKADCLNYITTFRSQLPKEAYVAIMPLLLRHLPSEEFVIHTYAAIAIEKLLAVKDNGVSRFTKDMLRPFVEKLLIGLFAVLDHEESVDNDYVMKAIMRVCSVGQETMHPFYKVIVAKIVAKLTQVSTNPRNASFNHYLFETLSCLITYITKADPSSVNVFEQQLMGPFQQMLNMETCVEFGPYIFQLLSQLLESRPDISDPYKAIFPVLLMPQLWENQGNVPAVVRLLQAYLKKGATQVVIDNRLTGLLGIFQKLLASPKMDQHGMDLIDSIVEYIPLSTFSPFLPEIFRLIFTRLRSKTTPKLAKHVILFTTHLISKHGTDVVLAAMDQVQPGIFSMLLEKIMLVHINTISSPLDKKTAVIGFTTLVARSPKFLEERYLPLWAPTVGGIVKILENKEQKASAEQEDEDLLDASERSFNTSYAKLAFAPAPDVDFNPTVPDAKQFFATSLKQLVAPNLQKFAPAIQTLDQGTQTILQQYLA